MIADTISVRNMIRQSIGETQSTVKNHTYTEKTTEKDPSRRSVVFQFYKFKEAEAVAKNLKKSLAARGLTNNVKATEVAGGPRSYGGSYVRVIARMK